jgi:2'-5' RNA ligase
VRLFFAIELPSAVRSALAQLRSSSDSAYRWVDAEQIHVTLAFLGEQPSDSLPRLEVVGAAAAAASRAARLQLGEPGSFGPRRAPRVLWIGLDGDVAALLALQSRLAAGLKEAGFPLEDREFRPHVTLARRRPNAPPTASAPWPPPSSALPHRVIPLDTLTLFQSRLSPRGATYHPLGQFPLA